MRNLLKSTVTRKQRKNDTFPTTQSDVHSQHELAKWRVFFPKLKIFSADNVCFSSVKKVRNLYFLVVCYSFKNITAFDNHICRFYDLIWVVVNDLQIMR